MSSIASSIASHGEANSRLHLTLDDTAEYHTDSDSGSDDDDPADGQLSD